MQKFKIGENYEYLTKKWGKNWRELSPDLDAMNAPQVKGTIYKSYGYVKNDVAYMVAINNPEDVFTCSLAAKYFDIIKFKKFLSEFYKVKLVNKSSQGIQTQEIYKTNMLKTKTTHGATKIASRGISGQDLLLWD